MDQKPALPIQIYLFMFIESDVLSPLLYCMFVEGYRDSVETDLSFKAKTTLVELYPSSLKI